MIKYCDRCKWDEMTQSKAIPESEEDLKNCPICGQELDEAENYDSIP